jgi:hypothetical protein
MIPTNENRTVTSSGVTDATAFGISLKDSTHIMTILRDTLYSDKILAVLREYGANAWDAQRMTDPTAPISITIPTHEDRVLRIRDFGPGLSPDDVKQIYTQYGASTKRSSNAAVGMLGIGSKSGFAYADSFTVTSYHGGVKRTYVAVLDATNAGTMNLLCEEPTTETGVEISITVQPKDISDFQQKARGLFKFFSPRPTINIDLPSLPDERTVLNHGTLVTKGGWGTEWVAVMGCIPYRIDLSQLPGTPAFLQNLSGTLMFPIGGVEFSASREALKYSETTKKLLAQKFTDLVDEYVEQSLNALQNGTFSQWDLRLRVTVLSALDLPLPKEWKDLAEGHVKVEYATTDFTIISNRNATTRISVTDRTRVLLDDTGNDLKGYYLGIEDYVVRAARKDLDAAALRVLLDDALTLAGLTGVPVVNLSTLPFTPPYVKPKKQQNVKHRCAMFTLKDQPRFSSPYSDGWDAVSRTPDATDVYVILESFQAYDGFGREYRNDAKLAKALGATMPTVYGYKSTEKKPVTTATGVEYRVWRKQWILSVVTPEIRAQIEEMRWAHPFGCTLSKESRTQIAAGLGGDHPIVEAFAKGETHTRTIDDGILEQLAQVVGMTEATSDAYVTTEWIKTRYPLLALEGFNNLYQTYYHSSNPAAWHDYVKMVDEIRPLPRAAHLVAV